MLRNVWTTIVPKRVGEEIIVAHVQRGTAASRWEAQRVINALRTKVALDHIGLDVVIIDGDLHDQPTLAGSTTDAETYVRSILSQLASFRWKATKLDW